MINEHLAKKLKSIFNHNFFVIEDCKEDDLSKYFLTVVNECGNPEAEHKSRAEESAYTQLGWIYPLIEKFPEEKIEEKMIGSTIIYTGFAGGNEIIYNFINKVLGYKENFETDCLNHRGGSICLIINAKDIVETLKRVVNEVIEGKRFKPTLAELTSQTLTENSMRLISVKEEPNNSMLSRDAECLATKRR